MHQEVDDYVVIDAQIIVLESNMENVLDTLKYMSATGVVYGANAAVYFVHQNPDLYSLSEKVKVEDRRD